MKSKIDEGSPSKHPIYDKIDSFGELKKGWHFGEGIRPREANMSTAKAIASLFQNSFPIAPLDAFPGVDGEISINAYPEGYCYEAIVESDGTLSVSIEDEKEVISDTANVDLSELNNIIKEHYHKRLWNMSAYSPSSITSTVIGSGLNLCYMNWL